MSIRVAEMYTRVAENKVLANPNVHSCLPASHHVLNELGKLEIPDLEFSVKHGLIRPTMSLGEAKNMVKSFQRSPLNKPSCAPVRYGRASAHTEVTETTEFTTIVVDPPWESTEVPTVSLDELRELTIPAADNAHLYLWLTDSFAPYAYRIVRDWGFTDRTVLTWFKPKPSGSFDYFRLRTERILFAVKGTLTLPSSRPRADDWFEAPIPRHGGGRPKRFYEVVEQASPGPYLEIFGRLPRKDWVTRWGD